jgi:DNA-3-methyladenine glycosylase
MSATNRLPREFYIRDVLSVAPELIGKELIVGHINNEPSRYIITEVEAYWGPEDQACHASKGRTRRTEIMYHEGGRVYVYFVYGMYWMLNIVTGKENEPQAALIRGIEGFNGPGKLTCQLKIDGTFYGEDVTVSNRIWIEDNGRIYTYKTGPRIGIDYAGKPWTDMPWRFYL